MKEEDDRKREFDLQRQQAETVFAADQYDGENFL